MSEPWIGQIIQFGGNFAIRNYALCDGQLIAISSNEALFALIGTTYGGDGRTNFALPDLRGRVPLGQGGGPGLTPRRMGEQVGSETVTLSESQIPPHDHGVVAAGTADAASPAGKQPAGSAGFSVYSTTPDGTMNSGMVAAAGGGQSHLNMAPSLGVGFQIALAGIFPSRN